MGPVAGQLPQLMQIMFFKLKVPCCPKSVILLLKTSSKKKHSLPYCLLTCAVMFLFVPVCRYAEFIPTGWDELCGDECCFRSVAELPLWDSASICLQEVTQ